MSDSRPRFLIGALVLGALLAACEAYTGTPPPGAESQPGFAAYKRYCGKCHGLDGRSERSRKIAKEYVNLVDPEWRAGTDRATLRDIALDGRGRMDGLRGKVDPDTLEVILDFVLWMPVDSTAGGAP